MTEELEQALRRTLTAAAERAPKAPPGIGLDSRPARRPRGYPRVALAAAAVALAIGGATVGGRTLLTGMHASGSSKTGASPALHRLKKTAVPAMEKVWPQAIHRVPATLPNGRRFQPLTFLDAHTLLVNTEFSFEKADALYAYDLRKHTTRRITTVVTPAKTKMFASYFTTGDGYVAWAFAGDYGAEVWAAPLAGGEAHRVARTDATTLDHLAIDGGNVYWSLTRSPGVYRAPIAGGTARLVEGTGSAYILQWPWVGSPRDSLGTATNVRFATIKNVRTGETRSARLTDRAAWHCGLTWCVGQTKNFVTEAQRRDGGGRHAIPDVERMMVVPPSLDRFVITKPAGGTIAVYDLKTGLTGDLGVTSGKKQQLGWVVPQEPGNPLYYTVTDGGYVLVDLAAI
ncbi:hypothetical protein [Actinoallomurus acaciae]|uniref:WD40 repeat domain-containing protein n=1 Tax=Actinoallomurus acaciae TaxID=502577 RepID=A0ABV5YHU8_9ACTN